LSIPLVSFPFTDVTLSILPHISSLTIHPVVFPCALILISSRCS
jgi:hypothetical protein